MSDTSLSSSPSVKRVKVIGVVDCHADATASIIKTAFKRGVNKDILIARVRSFQDDLDALIEAAIEAEPVIQNVLPIEVQPSIEAQPANEVQPENEPQRANEVQQRHQAGIEKVISWKMD